uniref:Uncharacterized protein n=1 Tax=Zea mays TaxID=4577 RepID=B4FPR0_MAIZE|nr:unknown [Zea mays]
MLILLPFLASPIYVHIVGGRQWTVVRLSGSFAVGVCSFVSVRDA